MSNDNDALTVGNIQTWSLAAVQRYLACASAKYLPEKDFFINFYCWADDEFEDARSMVDDQLHLFENGGEDRLTIERTLISQGMHLFDHRRQRRRCTWFVDEVKKSPDDRINQQCVNQLFISWCRRSYIRKYPLRRAATLQTIVARNARSKTQTRDRCSTVESQSSYVPSETSTPALSLPGMRGATATLFSLTPSTKRPRSLTDSNSAVSLGDRQPRRLQRQSATDQSSNQAVLSPPSQVLAQFNSPRSHTHDAPIRRGQKRNSDSDGPETGSNFIKQILPTEVTLEKLMVFAVMITTHAERSATVTILDRTKYFRVDQFLNGSTGRVKFQQLKDFATQNIESCSIYWVGPSHDGTQILPISDEYAAEIAFETLHERVSRDRAGLAQIFIAASERLVSGVPKEELCRRGEFETRVVFRERHAAASWWSWVKNVDREVNDTTGLYDSAAED